MFSPRVVISHRPRSARSGHFDQTCSFGWLRRPESPLDATRQTSPQRVHSLLDTFTGKESTLPQRYPQARSRTDLQVVEDARFSLPIVAAQTFFLLLSRGGTHTFRWLLHEDNSNHKWRKVQSENNQTKEKKKSLRIG